MVSLSGWRMAVYWGSYLADLKDYEAVEMSVDWWENVSDGKMEA